MNKKVGIFILMFIVILIAWIVDEFFNFKSLDYGVGLLVGVFVMMILYGYQEKYKEELRR